MGGKVHILFKYWLFCCLSLCFVLLTLGTSSSVRAQETDIWEATIPDPQFWWITTPPVFDPADLQTTKHEWNLSWIATDDIMPYLTFSKGYKTGNVGRSDSKALLPEFLTSWEFGLKSRFFNNHLQVNLGAYYFEYKNQNNLYTIYRCQGTSDDFDNCSDYNQDGQTFMDNDDYFYNRSLALSPGETKQQGVSANIMWMITHNDIFALTASYSNNRHKEYDEAAAMLAAYPDSDSWKRNFNRDLSGEKFGGPIRANASYNHTWHFGQDILSAFGTLFYEGKGIDMHMNYGTDAHYVMPGQPSYWTGDVSASYSSSRWVPDGTMWHIRFKCNNLFDNDALSSINYSDDYGFEGVDVYPTGSGTISSFYILPRTYSIAFGINW